MAETNISTKFCTCCKTDKSIDQYHKDKRRKDGFSFYCKPCVKEKMQAQYIKHKDKRRAYALTAYQENREDRIKKAGEWSAANKEKRREINKRYRENNTEARFETQKKQREKNPGYYRAHFKMRQTRKRQALSAWADLEAIEAIYRQCAFVSRFTGIKHHVDHFYPLTSDIVCGLHNQYNLRILPATENLSKGNSFPDQEE